MTESEQSETETTKSVSKSSSKSSGSSTEKYSVERLLEDAYPLTGYPRHLVAGALYGKSGSFSADQAKSAVEKFLQTPVKEG